MLDVEPQYIQSVKKMRSFSEDDFETKKKAHVIIQKLSVRKFSFTPAIQHASFFKISIRH